jgi:hypothetical protein
MRASFAYLIHVTFAKRRSRLEQLLPSSLDVFFWSERVDFASFMKNSPCVIQLNPMIQSQAQ